MRACAKEIKLPHRVSSCCVQCIDVIIGFCDSGRGHNRTAGGPGEDRTPDPMVANYKRCLCDGLRQSEISHYSYTRREGFPCSSSVMDYYRF